MKYNIGYQLDKNISIVKTNGKFNSYHFIKMSTDLLLSPLFNFGSFVLFDHRLLDYDDVRLEDLNEIRDFHKSNDESIDDGKSAILVRSIDKWNYLWSIRTKIKV